jgi:hypothetical protein
MSRKLAALLLSLCLSIGSGWHHGHHLRHRPGHWYRGPVVASWTVAR